ncbi:MAG TPA: hypothetical protein VL527_11720, partial [Dongiaceae bacterium]|nr:hypothetical protein [Dongiaceae bacterium]
WDVKIEGENADESPYVVMTAKLIEAFPRRGGTFQIEPDASSGSYFWAAGSIGPKSPETLEFSETFQMEVSTHTFSRVSVAHWPQSGWQIDERFDVQWYRGGTFQDLMRSIKQGQTPDIRAATKIVEDSGIAPTLSRKTDLGDSIMTAIVISPLIICGSETFHFTDLGRLRVQECERVVALRTELTRCGAKVIEAGDTLTVYPSQLHGAEIETYNDHRMAMCFAILGLKVPGIKIKNPACVKKTFPNFFQKLAAPPPGGLGVTIRDGTTGRELKMDELFAE